MRKTLQLIITMSLFLCAINLNAQNDNTPKVKVTKERGGIVIQLDNQYHYPYDVSDNGQHVAIQSFEEGVSFYWSEATGLVQIDGHAFAVSDDGIIAGYFLEPTLGVNAAGLWSPETREWTFLGMNPDFPNTLDPSFMVDYSNAWGMTNDGSTLLVMHSDENWNSHSYLWTEENGYVRLNTNNYVSSRANTISNDASVVVGHSVADMGWLPCYWIDGEYNDFGEDTFGEALGVSSEGTYLCGYLDGATPAAFTYDIVNDEFTRITNTLSEGNAISATCVNNLGETFGYYATAFPAFPDTRRAFAFVGGELITFNDYLSMNGMGETSDWTIYSVNSVTADGSTFSAAVNISGVDYSVIIIMEESECEGPKNLSYTISEEDYNNVTLTWDAPENPVDVTYEIYTSYTADTPLYDGITETSFEIEDLEPGQYNFIVRANWGGECLSSGSNSVKVTINACAEDDMCELRFELSDSFNDGWNNAYIEIISESTGIKHEITCPLTEDEVYEHILKLCPDNYLFTWVAGQYDYEISFKIHFNDEVIFSVEREGIDENFGPLFLEYDINCGTSVDEITAEDNIDIMPNPASNYFNIEGENILNVVIYNAVGQVVEIINVNGSNVQINTENYNNGIYFVRVLNSDANVTVKKVVVSK